LAEKVSISELRVKLLRAVSDPVRLEIINFLKGGERCVCEIFPAFKKSQSTVSKHLDILYEAGVLDRRVDGKRTLYKIRDKDVFKLLKDVDLIVLKRLSDLTKVAETLHASVSPKSR
jgi:ArsR family transcriptional regulator